MPWVHVDASADHAAWEPLVAEMADAVKDLKAGGDKDAIGAAVAELLHRKGKYAAALEAAIIAMADGPEKEALRAKLPPPPKPDKKAKKAEKAAGGAPDAAAEANKKANEDLKAAARAKKKAEAEAKKAGGGGGGAAEGKPAAEGTPAAVKPAAAPAGAKPAGGKPAAGAKPAGAKPAAAPAAAPTTGKPKAVQQNKMLELAFAKDAPPMLALLASRLSKTEVVLKRVEPTALGGASCVLTLPLGRGRFCGEATVARLFARLGGLYGTGDAYVATEVDQWLERAAPLAAATDKALAAELGALNAHLGMRAVLAGHGVSLADGAVWLALKHNAAAGKAAASGAAGPHLRRWWKYVDGLAPCQAVAVDFFGTAKDAGNMEIPLPNAVMGGVVTRFPPEPSGHLHIGHVKAAMLNAHFAESYKGKMLLRFDDTNPSKEKEEYEEAILHDLQSLDIRPHAISHTSDWFPQIKAYCEGMLKDGIAFVDPSPQEEQQKLRFDRKPSPHRDAPVAENLRLWKEMHLGSEEGLKCCVRAKVDYASENGTMRDPTIFRTNVAAPHARTKDTYKAYPTYDLACPIVDSLEGVTHALRDRQYSDRDVQYAWFLSALKLRPVELWGFSRINFVRTLLSKRKLQWLIDERKAEGWDDPRFPTVGGILRRGMTVSGLKTFILSMGASKNSNLMEWDKIWAMNKAVIDPLATRYTALLAPGLVPFTLAGAPAAYAESLYKHPKDQSLGKKVRLFAPTVFIAAEDAAAIAEGEEVTLMSWGNAIAASIKRDASGAVVAIEGSLHLSGSVKTTKKKLTWLADTPDLVDVELVDLDFLLSKDKVEEADDVESLFVNDSVLPYAAKGESAMRNLQKGEIIQVERRGYYVCDVPYVRPSDPMRLLFVPDGKNMFGVPRASSRIG